MKVISRSEARVLGRTKYFTGKACLRGHIAERQLSSCHCVKCAAEHSTRWRAENIERSREITRECAKRLRALRPERYREISHNYNMRNREKRKERAKQYYPAKYEKVRKIADMLAVIKSEMPELLKEFGL